MPVMKIRNDERKNKIIALKKAINEGFESGIASGFDPHEHLIKLKSAKLKAEASFQNLNLVDKNNN